jgi:hypothetical protein
VERRLVGSRWNKLDSETAKNGWKAVAFTRLIPLFPFNLLNFAFGLTKISFVQYALATFIFMLPGTIAFITFSSSLLGLLKGRVSREFFIGIVLIIAVSMIPKIAGWFKNREKKPSRPHIPWTLRSSLQSKAVGLAAIGVISAGAYGLIQHFFWALNAYMYTIEFNLLFVAHRLKDANLNGFVEYLMPMSIARSAGIALICQTMHAFVYPFSSLKMLTAFTAAFGIPTGVVYSGGAGLVVTGLAALLGRFILGDLLPLYNQHKRLEPLTPSSTWAGWCAAAMSAVPGFPLLLCGLWIGGFRLPLFRSLAVIIAGLSMRLLILIAAT